ncbi:MAG: Gfo/Idh/MocA family oxidoreductase [Actinomycetota bacterium]|nr:Gfo/Idh/MocA family oxidoreductase [Actinomycetota bacterium]
MNKKITVAVIGAGMAGQAHAYGFRNATMHPALSEVDIELSTIADASRQLAESVSKRYGFARAVDSVDAVVEDDSIDAVSVALPNFAYAEVIPRLIGAGKHVLAEKPLGRSAAEAYGFATAADAAEVVHGVGFSFSRLGAIEAIETLLKSGAIGNIRHLSAWYLTDYAATEETPFSWRYDKSLAGGGAIVDVGAHIISVIERLAGPINRVIAAEARTLIPSRRLPAGTAGIGHGHAELSSETAAVTTDDVTGVVAELAGGGLAQITASRVATGVPNSLGFQIIGSDGSIAFDSMHADEFQLFQPSSAPAESNGARTVLVGPEQPAFAYTIPMPARGVGSGYGAAFVAQAQDFVGSIVSKRPITSDFWAGYQTMLACDAVQLAAAGHSSVDLSDLDKSHRGPS